MKFDYIEIGTSNFDTLCQENPNLVGISIEPLDVYLKSLPSHDSVIRLNCAISNYKGQGEVFYVHPDDIDEYNLPEWLKGCNSFNALHPSTSIELEKRELTHLVRKKMVEVLTWEDLVERYDITKVKFLKIDTEGHDLIIINFILDLMEKQPTILPEEIFFESNILIDAEKLKLTISRLQDFQYVVIMIDSENTLVRKRHAEI
jgi:FkbM family methyltransferase